MGLYDKVQVNLNVVGYHNIYNSLATIATSYAHKLNLTLVKEALEELKYSTSNNVSELNKQLLSQSEDFKTFLKEEKNSFDEINEDLKAQFKDKIEEMPLLVDNIKEIAQIPGRLDRLVEKVEQSNANLAAKISDSLNHSIQIIAKSLSKNS